MEPYPTIFRKSRLVVIIDVVYKFLDYVANHWVKLGQSVFLFIDVKLSHFIHICMYNVLI
jgi:hypothetical protein